MVSVPALRLPGMGKGWEEQNWEDGGKIGPSRGWGWRQCLLSYRLEYSTTFCIADEVTFKMYCVWEVKIIWLLTAFGLQFKAKVMAGHLRRSPSISLRC